MIKPERLYFCTAGFPLRLIKNRNIFSAIDLVLDLGLDGLEMEFVRSMWLKDENAIKVKEYIKDKDVLLTAHGSYFINLASMEQEKVEASKKRILEAVRATSLANGYSVVFHAAYYKDLSKDFVYKQVKKQMQEIIETMKQNNYNVWLRPELTGKETQFGNLKELINLSQELEFVLPCIDFAHLHARYNGKYNTKEEYYKVFEEIEKGLGKEFFNNAHIHMSGINYGPKGEKNHLPLKESDFNWTELIEIFKEFNVKGALICESPNIEEDAILMKKYYKKIKKD